MASIKDIRFKATFDDKDVTTRLDKIDNKGRAVGKDLSASFQKVSKSTGMFSESLKNAFAGIGLLYAFKKALDFSIEAKNAARDAVEIRSKFDQVFISLADGANKLADSFAQSFGIAGTTARELLASTGDLLVGFGFTEAIGSEYGKAGKFACTGFGFIPEFCGWC